MANELEHGRNDELETLFQECLIDVILPTATTLDSLSRLDQDSPEIGEQLLAELGRRPHRTQTYYDEGLAVLVKLELPHLQGWTQEHAQAFLTSPALHVSTDVHYLEAPSASSTEGILGSRQLGSFNFDGSNLSVPSSPATFRGLGVRTPGFPYTPAPIPDLPNESHSKSFVAKGRYDDHTLGSLIGSAVWDAAAGFNGRARWVVVENGRAFVIWHMPTQLISWLPSTSAPAPIAITATVTLRLGSATILRQELPPASDSAPQVPEKGGYAGLPSQSHRGVHRRKQAGTDGYVAAVAKPTTQTLLSGILGMTGSADYERLQTDQILTSRTLSHATSRILKRASRQTMTVSHSLDVTLRVRKHNAVSSDASQDKGILCIELANNPSNGISFRIDKVEVKLDGSTKGIKEVAQYDVPVSHASVLSPYDQQNLVFSIEMEAKSSRSMHSSSRNGSNGPLPPSTPLAALLTPSQVLQSGRPLDPRMRIVRQPDVSATDRLISKEIQVIITGCPVDSASRQQAEVTPTAPFAMRWTTPFDDNSSSPLAQEGRRKPAMSPSAVTANVMKKQATSIGIRRHGASVPAQYISIIPGDRPRPQSSIQARPLPNTLSSQTLVQATAGSKRHTVAGLTQISQRMAYMSPAPVMHSPLPAASERPSLSRQPSRASATTIGIGQPPLNLQSSPTKTALPPHMASQVRPGGPASPKRSMSASALPTINTMFQEQSQYKQALSPASYTSSPFTGLALPLESGTRQSEFTSQRNAKSPLRSFTEHSLHGRNASPRSIINTTARPGTVRTLRPQQLQSHVVQALDPSDFHEPAEFDLTGKVLVSVAVLPSKEVAASLGLASEAHRDQGEEEDQLAMMRTRLATFKLGTASHPSSPPLPGILSPKQNALSGLQTPKHAPIPQIRGAISIFDVFLVEILVLNTSNMPIEMILRAPVTTGETSRAGIMLLDSRMTIGPLDPQACQSVRLRFLALQAGVHDIDSISVLDIATGREHLIRQPVTVVVA